MTRDEALQILRVPHDGNFTESLVDALVALVILKLDEPKTAEDIFREAIGEVPIHYRNAWKILDVLNDANLKIVEK